jgi:hypothetical protein
MLVQQECKGLQAAHDVFGRFQAINTQDGVGIKVLRDGLIAALSGAAAR